MELLILFGMAFAGFLIGFGLRGLSEANKNKNVEGYKSFYESNKIGV